MATVSSDLVSFVKSRTLKPPLSFACLYLAQPLSHIIFSCTKALHLSL